MTTHAGRSLAEWGPAPVVPTGALRAYTVPGFGVLVVSGLIATRSLLLALALLLVGAAGLIVFALSRGKAALREAQARPAAPGELPRVRNLLTGLASDLGVRAPELWVTDAEPNALVSWRAGPVVAVSQGLEEVLTRTECEAVLAHCMVRIRSGEARASTLTAGMGPFGPTGREAAQADLPAVAVTRYPPALASALEKMVPRTGAFASLWFAPDAGAEASAARRSAVLRDL